MRKDIFYLIGYLLIILVSEFVLYSIAIQFVSHQDAVATVVVNTTATVLLMFKSVGFKASFRAMIILSMMMIGVVITVMFNNAYTHLPVIVPMAVVYLIGIAVMLRMPRTID